MNELPSRFRSFSIRYGETLRPHRDWLALLLVAVLLLLGSLGWNVWHFFKVVEQKYAPADVSAAAEALDRATLESARAELEARAEEAVRYRDEYSFIDPGK